jgi:RNA polymerase sigma-70 factor, ECF subfamily
MEENERPDRPSDISGMRGSNEVLRNEIVSLLPRLRRFARAMTRDTHDADDLVQTTIERALARSDQLRADSKPSSWLFGILRNAWIDEARARARRGRVFASAELTEEIADPVTSSPAGALAVEDAMARLPEEQRMAVALVLIEGLSYAEAAEVMGVPIGTLTSRLARGRATLQTMLA